MFKRFKEITLTAAALALFSGPPARAEVPAVATDIAPVHALAAQVMEGLGAPSLIVAQGASPHGYAMRPSEAKALEQADAVFWIGAALTPWLEDAIQTLAADASVTSLLEAPETMLLATRTDALFQAHDHEGHDDHDHSGPDPHAWLDPQNAQLWLDVIARRLADLDPGNAAAYRANAASAQARIAALEEDLHRMSSDMKGRPFIVFHDAFQYFEARFGLDVVGAIALSDASAPGPARLEAVRGAVERSGARCVLSEPAFNPALVQTVIEGTDLRTVQVDPMGGAIAPGVDFYPALLRDLAAQLQRCLE